MFCTFIKSDRMLLVKLILCKRQAYFGGVACVGVWWRVFVYSTRPVS